MRRSPLDHDHPGKVVHGPITSRSALTNSSHSSCLTHGDANVFGQSERGAIANRDASAHQFGSDPGGISNLDNQKIRRGGREFQPHRSELAVEVRLRGLDDWSRRFDVFLVLKRSQPSGEGEGVDAPGGLEAADLLDQLWLRHHEAQPDAGECVFLGHRAQNENVAAFDELNGIPSILGERHVGIIENEEAVASDCGPNLLHALAIEVEAGRVVGIAEEDEAGARPPDEPLRRLDRPGEVMGFPSGDAQDDRTGQTGGGFVLAEGRLEDQARCSFAKSGPGDEMNQLCGAVADQQMVRSDPEPLGQGFPQRQAILIGIGGQVSSVRGLAHPLRGPQRIDVGAEVDHLLSLEPQLAQFGGV